MHHLMLVESDEDLRQKLTERLQEEVSKVKVHGFEDSAAALKALDTLKPLTLIVGSNGSGKTVRCSHPHETAHPCGLTLRHGPLTGGADNYRVH